MKTNTKKLTTCAVLIALGVVLSFVKVWEMPLGGSITLLSMLPITMISIKYGVKDGLLCAFVYSIIQLFIDFSKLMSWGLTWQIVIGSIIFDYILAYTVLGFAGVFSKKNAGNICSGIFLAMALRFISHFISGVIFFGSVCPEGWNPALYSICYNGAYMLPEMLLTAAATVIIFRLPSTSKVLTES